MNNYKLIQGDCIEEMNKLIDKGVKVDMVLTDLPYSITQCKWDTNVDVNKMWKCLKQLTNSNTPIILFGNEPFSSNMRLSQPTLYKYDIIWDKEVRTGHLNAKKQPLRQYENIMVFYNKQPTYNPLMWTGKETNHSHRTKKKTTNVYGKHHEVPTKMTKQKYPTNIVKFNARKDECNNTKRLHPTQKPVKLLEYLILTYTNKGDTILDFTMGSGSTGVACINTNRNFIGIEIDTNYYEIANDRLNKANKQNKLL